MSKQRDTGARVRNDVKTRDLETRCFDLETLCFDMDAPEGALSL
jgi:hypothetical protein